MGEKIVVGPINKGLRNDRTAFVIDNDSFPTLINAYQWRGRVKRKRGTTLLGRLERFFNSNNASYTPGGTVPYTITLDASGNGNLLSGTYSNGTFSFSLQTNGNIVPGSVVIVDTVSAISYTDPAMDGTLSPSGTINYASGAIQIAAAAGHTIRAQFLYFPDLPAMGLEDFYSVSTQFPGTIGFDTKYSYNISTAFPYNIYDVSFYKNPPTGTYPGYTEKTNVTPTSWNGEDYQQFWAINYQGAMWATNGIAVPFNISKVGMQFSNITAVAAPIGNTVVITVTGANLVPGDFVFLNEFDPTIITGINFQTGYVIAGTAPGAITIELPNATLAGAGGATTSGIVQYLTNRSDTTIDCLRWYDGDPTNGNATNPTLNGHFGWVNFMPPLSNLNYSFSDLPLAQYYLVGARLIMPFKDRLLFLGPVVQTSTGAPIYLQDTVVYSQNGTPYYTASFTVPGAALNYPLNPTTPPGYVPILVPTNQTATPMSYFEDITGFGGSVQAAIDQEILTVGANEDVLIIGFTRAQARFIYTGNDIIPFVFYLVNSELGSGSSFSSVVMDEGVISKGSRGFIITTQTSAQRIDLEIPDEVFELKLPENGTERVCSHRDFINEWIFFTYPVNSIPYKFPTQTLQYNYRDQSWGVFRESYTTYGTFRRQTGQTWATLPTSLTWETWDEPWEAGNSTLLQPEVIAGNQQGFVLFRNKDGTGEGTSLYIENISFPTTITNISQAAQAVVTAANNYVVGQHITFTGVVGMTQINGLTGTVVSATPTQFTVSINSLAFTPYASGGIATPVEPIFSPDHCLSNGDYITISGALGTISTEVNGKIFSVVFINSNGFSLNPPLSSGFTYLGGGLITRMYVPQIQTKQFPVAWDTARKTRLGPQQYLLTTTSSSQITLLIFLSQDGANAYNEDPQVPDPNSTNNALVYSTVLYTCPESANLGLTAANTNLQMPTAASQAQIWHRINTSLIGDTIQVGFTMSDTQMRDPDFNNQFEEIELHSIILDVSQSQMLA